MMSSSCSVRLFGKSSPKIRWITKPKYAVHHAAATGCRSATVRRRGVVVRCPTFRTLDTWGLEWDWLLV